MYFDIQAVPLPRARFSRWNDDFSPCHTSQWSVTFPCPSTVSVVSIVREMVPFFPWYSYMQAPAQGDTEIVKECRVCMLCCAVLYCAARRGCAWRRSQPGETSITV